MSVTPGWYVDLQDPQVLRWFDGEGWTADVSPLSQPDPPPVVTYADPAATPWATPPWAEARPPLDPRTLQPQAAWTQPGPTSPPGGGVLSDGAILAEWWQRLLASMLDSLIVLVVVALAWIPWYGDLLAEVFSGAAQTPFSPTAIVLPLISMAVRFVYNVGFLAWKQATPGKMALGMVVRRLPDPQLTLGDVLKRQSLDVGATLISFVSSPASIVTALDPAWLLWDPKRQTLHDKIAGTVVVMKSTTMLAPRGLR